MHEVLFTRTALFPYARYIMKFRYLIFGRLFPCILFALVLVGLCGALAVWLPRALAPLWAVERLFSFLVGLTVADAALRAEGRTARFLLLLLLPWVGALVCLAKRSNTPFPAPVPSKGRGIPALCKTLGGTVSFAESAEYFPVGNALRPCFLNDLSAAKKRIWLEYYIIAPGAFWGDILAILKQKAASGVDVRLIYDDFGCAGTLPRGYERELRRASIHAFACNKLRLGGNINRRNHRKLALIDGEIAYTGGINLADEYTGETVRFGHWKDSAVRLTGGPVHALEALFAKVWNARFPGDKLSPAENEGKGDIPCAVFHDDADGSFRRAANVFRRFIAEAKSTLYLTTPYLMPDASLADALKDAALAGVDVRLMIPHIPDKRTVFCVTRKFARLLEKSGVKVREYTAGFLHAKNAVADGKNTVIGSYNLDLRSLYLQAECAVYLEHAPLARAVEQDFERDWEASSPVPKATLRERFICLLLRPFSPLI